VSADLFIAHFSRRKNARKKSKVLRSPILSVELLDFFGPVEYHQCLNSPSPIFLFGRSCRCIFLRLALEYTTLQRTLLPTLPQKRHKRTEAVGICCSQLLKHVFHIIFSKQQQQQYSHCFRVVRSPLFSSSSYFITLFILDHHRRDVCHCSLLLFHCSPCCRSRRCPKSRTRRFLHVMRTGRKVAQRF
jgi:hypothetical protein